jgi:uncharacterized protein YndB with AHSA1/START domain
MGASGARSSDASHAGKDLTITRLLDAPRAMVFKAWTDAKHVAQWWGPHEFTNPRCEWDLRPGGEMRIDMLGPDGMVFAMSGVFHEVVEPERIVYTNSGLDEDGEKTFEILVTVRFVEQGRKTVVSVHSRVLRAGPGAEKYLAEMEMGWTQCIERLGEFAGRETLEKRT